MKILKYISFTIVIALLTTSLMNCKKDDDGGGGISAEESEAISMLTGTWTLDNVTQDGEEPQLGDYSGLTVTFNGNPNDGSGKTYSVTNGGPAFDDASNESWDFIDPNFTVIRRADDGFAMRIEENTETTLVLTQTVNEELGPTDEGRVAYIGEYRYEFSK